MPYIRDEKNKNKVDFYTHLGIYAYRTEVLKKIIQLDMSMLEIAESLEQNRWIENGYKIFGIVSIVLLILSFLNPFLMIPNVTVMYGIILNIMHVVVAGALLYFIKKAYK